MKIEAMNSTYERIYRIWSEQKEDHLSVRVQFSIEDSGNGCLIRLGGREEWS